MSEPSKKLLRNLARLDSQVRTAVLGIKKLPRAKTSNPYSLEIENSYIEEESMCYKDGCPLGDHSLCNWFKSGSITKKCKCNFNVSTHHFADGKKLHLSRDKQEKELRKRLRKDLPRANQIERQLQAEERKKAREARKEGLKKLAERMAELELEEKVEPKELGVSKYAHLKSLV